jgi:hypothetical protein
MRKDFEQLFTHLDSPNPPAYLLPKIMQAIADEKQPAIFKGKLVIFSLMAIFSVAAAVYALVLFKTGAAESGFWQFISLLFSDYQVVVTAWQNYLLSLIETLPLTSLILLLSSILIFCESIKLLSKDIKNIKLAI